MPQEFKVKNGLLVDQGGANITGSSAVSGSVDIAGSLRLSLEPSASAVFRVSSGSNTLLNVNSPGRLWLGNGAFVDAGYQADIQGSTRITGKLETYGTYFYGNTGVNLAPTMSGSNGAYQNLSAVTIAPTFNTNVGFGAQNTALDITNGNLQIAGGGSLVIGGRNDVNIASRNQYVAMILSYQDAYGSNQFITSRSGSVGIGASSEDGGAGSSMFSNIYFSNPRNVLLGHGIDGGGDSGVGIGYRAGLTSYAVNIGAYAMGAGASYGRVNSVNIGYRAGYYLGSNPYNGDRSISIGYEAGFNGSTVGTVALGYQAGWSGSNPTEGGSLSTPASVYIGYQAGYFETSPRKLYISNTSTTSPLIGGDFFSGSVGINMKISDISASLHVKGTGATSASNALVVANSNLSNLLRISNNGQQFVTSPVMTLTSSNAGYLISQSLVHSGSIPFTKLFDVNITPTFTNTTSSQTQTALRVSAVFTGSASGSNTTNLIVDFGTQNSGSMFLVDDVVSGSVYTVNDFYGLPVLEVMSDAQVNMYDYPYAVFNKSASYVSLGLPSTFAIDSAVYLRADTVMDEGFGFSSRMAQGNGTTLNDSTASLYTYTFGTNTGSAHVNAIVTGYDSASRATVSGEIKSTIKCLSGVASIIGTNFRYINAENAGVNIDLTVTSNTFSVKAYGTGSRTYVWAATVTTQVI